MICNTHGRVKNECHLCLEVEIARLRKIIASQPSPAATETCGPVDAAKQRWRERGGRFPSDVEEVPEHDPETYTCVCPFPRIKCPTCAHPCPACEIASLAGKATP